MTTPIAIAYVRVSTDDQARYGISVEAQENLLRNAAAAMNVQLARVVTDSGVSGSVPFTTRPGGAEIIRALRAGTANVVLVVAVDRLGRDAEDIVGLVSKLDRAGVKVWANDAGGFLNRDNVTDRIMLSIRAEIAQEERAKVKIRTRAGILQLRESGKRFNRGIPMTARAVPIPGAVTRRGTQQMRLEEDPVRMEAARFVVANKETMTLRALATELRTRFGLVGKNGEDMHPQLVKNLGKQANGWKDHQSIRRAPTKEAAAVWDELLPMAGK